MRLGTHTVLVILLVALPLGGCGSSGPQIPPTKGGAQSREEIEHPFGQPKNLNKMKKKVGSKAANPATNPNPVH